VSCRAAQVWKERWFSLADDGHLVYWKNQKVAPHHFFFHFIDLPF
jgi:hypothetical protein